jgi:hypothetical protein
MPLCGVAQNASLSGTVVDPVGAFVTRAAVELHSGTKKYEMRTDDSGGYQFSNLPAGEYELTLAAQGFVLLTVRSIELSEREAKRIPEITLTADSLCEFPPHRDFVRPISEVLYGELSGSVRPFAAGIEVILICRTFHACGSTKTDSNGRFSFSMLSPGAYGLSFQRSGFFPKDPTGYKYFVNAGLESVYAPESLEPCPDGNCEAKIQRILPSCE